MKTYIFIAFTVLLSTSGLVSCKKCYTCSLPYAALPGYGTGGSEFCAKANDKSQLQQLNADDSACVQLGGVWQRGTGQ